MLYALLLLAVLLCLGHAGWGPGNHLEFAYRVYRNRRRTLPAATATLLREERDAYFYGNIAADIINFKGFGGHYNHCHRWTIIEDMGAQAETRAEEAFILGYLSHLAADTIAHNHYVPYHLARYARHKGLGHLYWEMRADRFVPETRWQIVTGLKAKPELEALDDLVNRSVPKKALSMRTNKLLFNHVLLVAERDRWRRGIDRMHDLSSAPLEKEFLERFRRAAVARVRLALQPDGVEQLHHIDTNGKAAQRQAMGKRRRTLSRITVSAKRKQAAELDAAPYLEGMETPPPQGGTAHW